VPERPVASPKAVVFDLDDTLFDAFAQCVTPAQREAAVAMKAAGLKAPLEAIVVLREALSGAALDVDEAVAAAFPCADAKRVVEAGRRAFFERDPGAITPFPFAREVLEEVKRHARTVLLTSGSKATQRAKVERLGLLDLFDPLLFVDPTRGESKQAALAGWLVAAKLEPAQVLVVGDRPDGEIEAARRLGCRALRIRGGEWARAATPPGAEEAPDVRDVLRFFGGRAPPT